MSEHWWIDIDWESTYTTADKQVHPEFGIGSVNLAKLVYIRLRKENEERWEIIGGYATGGVIIIHVYKDKENALTALALLQKFLEFEGMSIQQLRLKLAGVGK